MSFFGRGGGGSNDRGNNSNAPVCKFFLEGRCRFGDSCKNYHPPRDNASSSGAKQSLPYLLSAEGIKADLTQSEEKPIWPLSAYGPGRDAPRQLLEGVLEQSPEELRVQYYLAKAGGGNTQEYEQNETSAVNQANQQAQQILNDVDGAIKYIVDGKDQHPNREDQVLKSSSAFNWNSRPSFNQTTALTSGGPAFGQQSSTTSTPAFGQPSSTFGSSSTSAFGKPSNPGFGQPSALGSGTPFGGSGNTESSPFGGNQNQTSNTSGFGKPSALGSGSAFGQPSALGGGSAAFGKPSALGGASPFGGQNTSSSTPFGQSSTNTGASPFGQSAANTGTSPFGQASTNTGGTAFGQPSAPGGGSAFGQASTPGSGTAFGKPSSFGAAASNTPAFGSSTPFGAQASSNPSAFGQPSQPGQQKSPFGQPSQQPAQSSPFGQSSQQNQPQSTFSKPSPFGTNAGTTSTFGQPAFGTTPSNPPAFGQPSAPTQQPSPFAAASTNAPNPFGSQQQQPQQAPTNKPFGAPSSTPGQRLTTWKGRPVTYTTLPHREGKTDDKKEYPFYTHPSTGKLERIWLPEGPPAHHPDREGVAGSYEALGEALREVYEFVRQTGTFKGGVVPEVPPRMEWVDWEI